MTKRKPIDISALDAVARPQADPVATAVVAKPEEGRRASPTVPGRAGRVQIQRYFPEETRRRLKVLAAQEGRTLEDLLGEAIADLLDRRRQ